MEPEPHRPYYLKSKGKERGTYIRVGGTSRVASLDKIRELELEGERISWDELTCIGVKASESSIRKLCRDMNRYRREMQERRRSTEKLPTVTRLNLENWNVLKKTGEGIWHLIHRNFLDESCVQVALYDDRLEVTSPGGLYHGLTLEEALSGRFRQRNRAVAEVFNQMGLIEGWGNGLKSIRANAREYGLPEPEFVEMPETFRVNLFRRPLPMYEGKYDVGVKHWQSIGEASVEEQQGIGEVSAAEQQSVGEAWEEDRQNIGVVPVGHPRGGNECDTAQNRRIFVRGFLPDRCSSCRAAWNF